MGPTKVLIIKSGGGVSCEHATHFFNDEDIMGLCEKCSELLNGGEIPETIEVDDTRLEYVCPHVFQLFQLPIKENWAKWIEKGNTLLCGDCAKKEAEVVK